ncbi:hypothetical protein IT575_15140 [bacterium]|nr:hypothetical protein [bacterium]
MLTSRFSAVFPNKVAAENAVKELRELGVPNSSIAVVTKDQSAKAAAVGAAEGLAVGAGLGALFGLAAVAIPGVGPFITAGWLASTLGLTGGAAASGAIVGGSAGLLAGALAKAGYAAEEAKFLSDRLDDGGVLVALEKNAPISDLSLAEVFSRHGGLRYA